MRELVRISMVSAWLAIAWTAAPLAEVPSVDLVVTVPLVVVAVSAVLVALERRGAGAVGIALTVFAVWMLAAATWGAVVGMLLLVSGVAVVAGPTRRPVKAAS
ncbi:hypothetical protein ACQP25_17435 [Microtetraspora malaysiensis]|uniref:hypothetical protein n=1 Tax=Microtetraspora malaysiensis TaxID=161358 RepID=UPI003D8E56BC